MAPPRGQRGGDEVDISKQLRELTNKVDKIGKQQNEITSLLKEVSRLRKENEEQAAQINNLENKVDAMEQYMRRENVIVSGLNVAHKTFARAADEGDEQDDLAPHAEQQDLEDKVVQFFQSKDIDLDKKEISACHIIGTKKRGQKPRIIIRFTNRKSKVALLKQGGKLQGTDVYVNEHLTMKNGMIAKHARQLKKKREIAGTYTRNGTIFLKLLDDSTKKVLSPSDFTRLGLSEMPAT